MIMKKYRFLQAGFMAICYILFVLVFSLIIINRYNAPFVKIPCTAMTASEADQSLRDGNKALDRDNDGIPCEIIKRPNK